MKSILSTIAILALIAVARPALADTGSDTEYGSWGIYNWEGTYVGLNGGYGWSNQKLESTLGTSSYDANGALLGLTLGVNADMGEWIVGMEGDIGWADFRGAAACGPARNCSSKVDALGTLRGRVGYEIQSLLGTYPLLAYATAGAAFGETTFKESGAAGESDAGKVEPGWVVGGGFEYALGDRWSVKTEYLHVDLDTDDYNLASGPIRGEVGSIDIVRGGINYRF